MTLLHRKSDKKYDRAISLVYDTAQRLLAETGEVNLGELVDGMLQPCADTPICTDDVRAAYEIILFRLEMSHGPLTCWLGCGRDEAEKTWTYAECQRGPAVLASHRKRPKLDDVVAAFAWRLATLQHGHPDADLEEDEYAPSTTWRRAA